MPNQILDKRDVLNIWSNASMQLPEWIKRSVNHCFISVKLHVILKSNVLFPPNLKDSVTIFLKSFLIYKFLFRYNFCYISHTTQRLDIKINQHIPPHIRTNTWNHSIVLSHQNPPSTIACHLQENLVCATVYNPTMFFILDSSSTELHLSILEVFLITKFQPKLGIQKEFYILILISNPFRPWEANITSTNSTGLH